MIQFRLAVCLFVVVMLSFDRFCEIDYCDVIFGTQCRRTASKNPRRRAIKGSPRRRAVLETRRAVSGTWLTISENQVRGFRNPASAHCFENQVRGLRSPARGVETRQVVLKLNVK